MLSSLPDLCSMSDEVKKRSPGKAFLRPVCENYLIPSCSSTMEIPCVLLKQTSGSPDSRSFLAIRKEASRGKVVMRWCPLFAVILLLFPVSGVVADGNVTLESLTIFNTHEWFRQKPEVYFRCQGEDIVGLPDVKEKDHLYGFLGQESWQPLTALTGAKCKRCGLYEKDVLKGDDVFDEWELCPLEFNPSSEGRYVRFKEKEFNITLLCPNCNVPDAQGTSLNPVSTPSEEEKSYHGFVAVLVVFVCLCLGALAFVAYSQWRRKQREEQQARFVKLFEDDDFLDEELGLKDGL